MPELPDLEVFKDNIFNRITSKKICSVEIFNALKVNVSKDIINNELSNEYLLSIGRIGKELYFNFSGDKVVSAHLMLNGEVSIWEAGDRGDNKKFKILAFNFENESVVFSDWGGLCNLKFMPLVNSVPDALSEEFTLDYLTKIAKTKSRMNIKAFLIDQSIVKGIGNAYADEILWDAKISPFSTVGKLPYEALTSLFISINMVLKNAIASIKSISPDIISGEVRSFLKVHNKSLKKTSTGAPVIIERIASKITYYTNEQVVYN